MKQGKYIYVYQCRDMSTCRLVSVAWLAL